MSRVFRLTVAQDRVVVQLALFFAYDVFVFAEVNLEDALLAWSGGHRLNAQFIGFASQQFFVALLPDELEIQLVTAGESYFSPPKR
jgi:hypothetical protein